jgi:hypothetical protein
MVLNTHSVSSNFLQLVFQLAEGTKVSFRHEQHIWITLERQEARPSPP